MHDVATLLFHVPQERGQSVIVVVLEFRGLRKVCLGSVVVVMKTVHEGHKALQGHGLVSPLRLRGGGWFLRRCRSGAEIMSRRTVSIRAIAEISRENRSESYDEVHKHFVA